MNTMSCEKHLGMGTVQNCAPCLQVELDYVRSEIEALRADVVWIFENDVQRSPEAIYWFDGPQADHKRVVTDGSPTDILRAVREARTK